MTRLIKTSRLILLAGALSLISACATPNADSDNRTSDYNPAGAASTNIQLGMELMQKQQYKMAKSSFLQATKDDPQNPASWYAMAYFYQQTKQDDKADEYYRYAIKLNPSDGASHNNYGTFLCRAGLYNAAIKQFNRAAQEPNYLGTAGAYENAGLCALQMKNTQVATKYFRLALNNSPKRATSLYELAQISYQNGDIAEAQYFMKRYSAVAQPTAASAQLASMIALRQRS